MRQKSLFIFVCCIQELTQKPIEGLDMGKRIPLKTRRRHQASCKEDKNFMPLDMSSVACLEAKAKNFYHVIQVSTLFL